MNSKSEEKIGKKSIRVLRKIKMLSLSKKILLITSSTLLLLVLKLVSFGEIKFIDGILTVFLPAMLLTGVSIIILKLILASIHEKDYKNEYSPVYKRLLKNREKIGRNK